LATAGKGDWILRQVTSNSYADPAAEKLVDADFATGSLKVDSFARPTKLFTGSQSLFVREVGRLGPSATARVVDAVIKIFRP
jgi:mRNA interferase MazF